MACASRDMSESEPPSLSAMGPLMSGLSHRKRRVVSDLINIATRVIS